MNTNIVKQTVKRITTRMGKVGGVTRPLQDIRIIRHSHLFYMANESCKQHIPFETRSRREFEKELASNAALWAKRVGRSHRVMEKLKSIQRDFNGRVNLL